MRLIFYSKNKITGTVTDKNGSPLPGVSVVVKGTTLGTLSDASGKYTIINVPQDATLIFSFYWHDNTTDSGNRPGTD